MVRSQKPGARSQESEFRSQNPGVRSQKSEVRIQKPESRIQNPEVRSQNIFIWKHYLEKYSRFQIPVSSSDSYRDQSPDS